MANYTKKEKNKTKDTPFTLQIIEVITKLKGKRQSAQYKTCRACV